MSADSLVLAVARVLQPALPTEAELGVEDVAGLLAVPPDASLGDLAFPCFRLARALRSAPPKIAIELAAQIPTGGLLTEVTAAGPYLNLRLALGEAAALVAAPLAAGLPDTMGSREARVMVEYSQPNTHKGFHVGHMRNLCLGDSIVRLLRAVGYPVVAANYRGDVGAHIAKCLWRYLDVLDDAQRQPPDSNRGEWLGEIYSAANNQLVNWEEAAGAGDDAAAQQLAAARARTTEILQKLEARDPELTAIWKETRQWCLDEFDEMYAWCNVHFDRVFYESEVDEPGLELVEEFLGKGTFIESQGAVGINNEEVKHMPFFMLRKSDGTSLYSTKDLALARLKFEEYDIDKSVYVVDMRQTDHFRHVFLTLAKMGFKQAEQCEHVSYEMVELPDGPMGARTGNVILFRTLRETMVSHLRDGHLAKYRGEWPDEEIEATAHAIALGAIKYGMLSRDVNQKIVFDLEAWLQLEGNTGPYLQYVVARSRSILRKAEAEGKTLDPAVLKTGPAREAACAALGVPEERELVVTLSALGRAMDQAADQLRPSLLCTYLFDLAKSFNRFNQACKVKGSEGALLQGRLLLVHATVEALRWGLDKLGIPAPQRM
jgi:arginyl-tRNA synthetase